MLVCHKFGHVGLTVRALYNFEGEAGEELDLKEGQIYRVYEQNNNGWWKGVTLFGKCGWYVFCCLFLFFVPPLRNALKKKLSRPTTSGFRALMLRL